MAEPEQRSLPVPLLIPTLGWCVGIGLAAFVHVPALGLVITGLMIVLAGFLLRFRLPLLMLVFILAGFLRLTVAIHDKPSPLLQVLAQKESITQPFTAEVLSVLNADRDAYRVRLKLLNRTTVSEQAVMYCGKALLPGDRFSAMGCISAVKPDPVLDNTSFFQSQLRSRTPLRISTVVDFKALPGIRTFSLERLRWRLLQNLDAKLGEAAPFAKALLLNDRTEDRDWIQQLIQGGVLHLIAISGMHVVFFYLIFVTLFGMVLPRKPAELAFVLLMLAYAGLCQWSAPVMRAIIMILLFLVAKWLQRPVAPLQIICLSLLVITIADPVQLFSVGLQLSYLCILALLYLVPKLHWKTKSRTFLQKRLHGLGTWLLNSALISVIISLVMLPVMFYYFNRGSLNGIIGNLAGVPLIGFLLPLALALLILPSNWLPFLWLKASFNALLYVFQVVLDWTASLPLYVDAVTFSLPWLIVAYLVLGAVVVRLKTGFRMRWVSYALLLLAVPFAVYSFIPRSQPFTLTIFNAGLGDCTLVHYPGGQNLMIDTGPLLFDDSGKEPRSWFGSRTGAWQRHLGLTRLDLLILTHLDADHSGGLQDVIKTLRVRNIMISSFTAQSRAWQVLQNSGVLNEAQVHILTDTLSFAFAGSTISILHPGKAYHGSSDNDNSLVVKLDYKGFSTLLAGDISSAVEAYLVENVPSRLDADLLKCPHHGSRFSSSTAFIKAVSPRQVCITAGRHNRFQFPDRETLRRYRDYGVEPQITGNGSVVVSVR
jgi:competence protein ComEC